MPVPGPPRPLKSGKSSSISRRSGGRRKRRWRRRQSNLRSLTKESPSSSGKWDSNYLAA